MKNQFPTSSITLMVLKHKLYGTFSLKSQKLDDNVQIMKKVYNGWMLFDFKIQ